MRRKSARLIDFKNGKTLWLVEFGNVYPFYVKKRPKVYSSYVGVSISIDGRNRNLMLGDYGVPGFNYDDRPCQVFRTRTAALDSLHKVNEWERSVQNRSLENDIIKLSTEVSALIASSCSFHLYRNGYAIKIQC